MLEIELQRNALQCCYVDLDPKINNKDIFEVRYISNAVDTSDPPKKVNDIV